MFYANNALSDLNPISAVDDFYSNMDPFSTRDNVSISPASNMFPSAEKSSPCYFTTIGTPLGLLEAVERALCNNPQTSQTWASVKMQAAQVGASQAAYLPTINATVDGGYSSNRTSSEGFSSDVDNFSSDFVQDNENINFSYNLDLTWILFDFGLRSANLTNARQLLAAANAMQDATLQAVFLSAAQSYFDLLSAMAAFDASLDSEKSARISFMSADAMHKAGVGTLADKLQAQTTYAQASLERVKANGELKNAHGTLAIVMGLSANTPLIVDKCIVSPRCT